MKNNENRLVVICIGCEILHKGTEVGGKIGNPIPHKQAAGILNK